MGVWYEDGIRFSCKGCGECCVDRGEYAYVFLNEGEEKSLAGILSMEVDEFLHRYTASVDGFIALVNEGEACVFLDSGGRCTVYRSRPQQCRTWPFWPEVLNRKTWRAEVAPHCPGIGKGRLHMRRDIDRIASESREADPLMAEDED